jgi:hypothetical protein
MYPYRLIPYFLTLLVVGIIFFSLIVWRRGKADPGRSVGNAPDPSAWLLLGFLLIGAFGLGAFIMYIFLRLG